MLTKTQINKLFATFKQINPNPTTELNYKSLFELLIAVILSAQATDVSVNKATKNLFAIANTPEKIISLGETNLKQYIKTIGLYNTKAKNIIATCKMLIAEHESQVPNNRKQLEDLPGVGRKTANVILNTAFKLPVIAVDTHIFRVSKRIGLAHGNTPLLVEQELEKIVPDQYKQDAHHWLILHGRYVCRAKKPLCVQCVIVNLCMYTGKQLEPLQPNFEHR